MMVRKLNGALVEEPSERGSWGRVEEDAVSAHCGVVVPAPIFPFTVRLAEPFPPSEEIRNVLTAERERKVSRPLVPPPTPYLPSL